MSRNYLNDLNELKRGHVHIKDPTKVNKTINEIVKGGFERLQMIFDFDKTITKQHENGKRHLSSFGLFALCKNTTPEYVAQERALTQKFVPIEVDPTIPLEEKKKHLRSWWEQSESILRGLTVSMEDIDETCKVHAPALRDGTKELFDKLYEEKVPVLVFSAGLGDTVVGVLKRWNVYLPNVKVVSNFLKYSEQGIIEGFQDKYIYAYNKNEYAIKCTDFYTQIKNRDNVILFGDSLGDADMAEGVEHSNVLKIGFLYERLEEALPAYKDAFDIVLADDQTMDIPLSIMNCFKTEIRD